MRQSASIEIIDHSETVEALLSPFEEQIGGDYAGYRGHIYRVLTYAMWFLGGDERHRRAIETALVYHDIGLWTDHDLAYLEPSIRRVIEDNAAKGWGLDPELLRNLIYWHHKVLPFRGEDADVVNAFRKADWVDATGGLIRHGLTRAEVDAVTAAIPEHGFRDTLNRLAADLAGGNRLKGLSRYCSGCTNGEKRSAGIECASDGLCRIGAAARSGADLTGVRESRHRTAMPRGRLHVDM